MTGKLGRAGLALMLLLGIAWGVVRQAVEASSDIEIQVGRKVERVRARARDGFDYYRLRDIAALLNLEISERGGLLDVAGPRGQLQLTDGRKLVRLDEQYLLISQPVWRRAARDWYVPEDFLSVAMPTILGSKLERLGDGRYRLQRLGENQVRVEILNYPDHVSIVFRPERQSNIRVTEFDRFLRVEFDRYQVVPEITETALDRSVVRNLRFDPSSVFGSFEIVKGSQFHHYRDHVLNDPYRKVVDVYGPPLSVGVGAEDAPSRPQPPPPAVVTKPEPVFDPTDAPLFRPHYFHNRITLDPGHGGESWGVQSSDLVEKDIAFKIAQSIQARFSDTPFKAVLTRNRDLNLSVEQRSAQANFNESKAFISIHLGGSPAQQIGGAVVYIQQPIDEPLGSSRLVPWELGQQRHLQASRRLGELIQQKMNQLFGVENQLVEAPLAVLAPVAAPAVLIEAGYLTNANDRRRLATPEFIDSLAASVAQALQEYLQ